MANNERDPTGALNIVKFGPDRIEKFLKTNYHSLILRSHQIAKSGFDKFADGQLITFNSFTNYCNTLGNDGCFFVVQKKFEITPKIIKPLKDSSKYWMQEQTRPLSPNRLMEI